MLTGHTELRDDLAVLPDKLDHVAAAVSQEMPEDYYGSLKSVSKNDQLVCAEKVISIAYYPQLGYLICLPLTEDVLPLPIEWTFQFQVRSCSTFEFP